MPYEDTADGAALCNRGEGSLVMSLFTNSVDVASRGRDDLRRLPRPGADRGPRLRQGIHRPRQPAARPDPRRPRPGRRRRGDGRHPRRPPLHAAHRAPGLAAHADRRSATAGSPARRRTPARRIPSDCASARWRSARACTPRARTITLEDIEHFAAVHRRHLLRPHGRGGRRGEPLLPRPRGARLPDPLLRGGPVRRPGAGAGAGQLRPGQPALPQACVAGRGDQGAAHRQVQVAAQRGVRRGALGRAGHQRGRRDGGAPTTC